MKPPNYYGSKLPYDWFWNPIFVITNIPLFLMRLVTVSSVVIFEWLDTKIESVRYNWICTLRKWSGRDERGYTPWEQAHQDALCENTLRSMRPEKYMTSSQAADLIAKSRGMAGGQELIDDSLQKMKDLLGDRDAYEQWRNENDR